MTANHCRIKTIRLKPGREMAINTNLPVLRYHGNYFKQTSPRVWERITLLEWVRASR